MKQLTHDLASKTDAEIESWISNHEKRSATAAELYHLLLEERGRRHSKLLNIETSLARLMAAARSHQFTSYGQLAKANNVPWNKARHRMNGAGGHLDILLDVCHARNLPLLTAICVNQDALNSGELEPHSLNGFVKGAQRLGHNVTDARAFLKMHQDNCFNWGRCNAPVE